LDPLHDVLVETDTFRIAIRGHALLEEVMEQGIFDAFAGKMPKELKKPTLPVKFALFRALVLLPEGYVKPMMALTDLRNDFAHGRIKTLTEAKARRLARVWTESFPGAATLEEAAETDEPRMLLNQLISVMYYAMTWAMRDAHELRQQQLNSVAFTKKFEETRRRSSRIYLGI
jgi:hypothetical protein